MICLFLQSLAVSTGTGDGDFEKLVAIVAAVPQIQYICVDVANGYSEHFVNFVKDVRQKFPTHTIMVSYPTTDQHFIDIVSIAVILIFWNHLYFVGWQCGHRRDGWRADSCWCWHHQSGHWTRWRHQSSIATVSDGVQIHITPASHIYSCVQVLCAPLVRRPVWVILSWAQSLSVLTLHTAWVDTLYLWDLCFRAKFLH